MQLNSYQSDGFYDEVFDAAYKARPEARLPLETNRRLRKIPVVGALFCITQLTASASLTGLTNQLANLRA
jgi:hypothetical protein